MEEYLDEIMNNQNFSAPVISIRDDINLKDTIDLLERQLEDQKLKPEIEVVLKPQQTFSELKEQQVKEFPLKTRVGRILKKTARYGT